MPEPAPPAPASIPATPAPTPELTPKAKSPPATPKATPKAEPDPFQGFAKAIALPPLPEGMAQPAAETLAPLTLGPCQAPADAIVLAKLKGGETATRGGKQKFELQPKDATASLDWEFQLTGGDAPLVIATLAAKEGSLVFQWTDGGVKHAALARQLCNCALDLVAGNGKHLVALRQPVSGQPLAIDFERTASVKWTIENLPDPKSIQIEVTKVEGLPQHKLRPESTIPVGDDFELLTGPKDEPTILILKISPVPQARNIQLTAVPRMQGQARRFNKKEVTDLKKQVSQEVATITLLINQIKPDRADPKDQRKKQLQGELSKKQKAADQIDQFLEFVSSLQGGIVHFRVYHQVEDGQVDLLVTSADGK
jgi:hypothetical protein